MVSAIVDVIVIVVEMVAIVISQCNRRAWQSIAWHGITCITKHSLEH